MESNDQNHSFSDAQSAENVQFRLAPQIAAHLDMTDEIHSGQPKSLCRVSPAVIQTFVERTAGKPFADLTRPKRKLLARIGFCRYSTEAYLEAKAALQGKRIVYVSNGIPLADVPVE